MREASPSRRDFFLAFAKFVESVLSRFIVVTGGIRTFFERLLRSVRSFTGLLNGLWLVYCLPKSRLTNPLPRDNVAVPVSLNGLMAAVYSRTVYARLRFPSNARKHLSCHCYSVLHS